MSNYNVESMHVPNIGPTSWKFNPLFVHSLLQDLKGGIIIQMRHMTRLLVEYIHQINMSMYQDEHVVHYVPVI